MATILRLLGNGMFAILDFTVGIFLVYLLGILLNHEVGMLQLLLGGILTLAPDFDVVYMLLRRGRIYGNHHEYFTHRPIVGIPLAAGLGYLLGGQFWAITAGTCLFWHYLHDTKGFGGGGMAWLWPLTRLYVSPFGVQKPEESVQNNETHGHNEGMCREILSPTKKSVIEYTIAAALLLYVGWEFFAPWAGVLVAALLWVFIYSVWRIHLRVHDKHCVKKISTDYH